MSSNQSQQEMGYQASKERREQDTYIAIKVSIQEFLLHQILIPADGLAMSIDAAFEIDRKALTVRALKEITSSLEK